MNQVLYDLCLCSLGYYDEIVGCEVCQSKDIAGHLNKNVHSVRKELCSLLKAGYVKKCRGVHLEKSGYFKLKQKRVWGFDIAIRTVKTTSEYREAVKVLENEKGEIAAQFLKAICESYPRPEFKAFEEIENFLHFM